MSQRRRPGAQSVDKPALLRRGWPLGRASLALPISLVIVIFGLIPLGTLLFYSFRVDGFYTIESDLTLQNYDALVSGLGGDVFLTVLRRTLVLATVVTLLSLVLGFATAYYIARYMRRYKEVALLFLIIPLFTSYLVKIYSWRSVLGSQGLVNYPLVKTGILDEPLTFFSFNEVSVGIALVSAALPFMILPIYASLERIPDSLMNAAADLGLGEARTLMRVVIPLSARGILAGSTFVFVLSFGDFVASQLLGGASGILIGKIIFSSFGLADNWPVGAAMAYAVMSVVAIVLALFAWIASRGGAADVSFESHAA